jgi:hypothetical protein
MIFFPHIYNNVGWQYERVVFFGSSSLKVGFGEINLGNNNLGERRLSNGFCTNIPTYPVFQIIHKTTFHPQSVANYFLNVHWFTHVFLDHHKASLTFDAEGRRVGSHACRFHSLACIYIMSYYPMVPLINSPIS